MTWENTTKLVLVLVTAFLVAYDILAAYYGGKDATISTVVLKYSCEYPVIAFALGVVAGHIFWRN